MCPIGPVFRFHLLYNQTCNNTSVPRNLMDSPAMGSPNLLFHLEAGVYSACGHRVFLTLVSLHLGFDIPLKSQVVSNSAIFIQCFLSKWALLISKKYSEWSTKALTLCRKNTLWFNREPVTNVRQLWRQKRERVWQKLSDCSTYLCLQLF